MTGGSNPDKKELGPRNKLVKTGVNLFALLCDFSHNFWWQKVPKTTLDGFQVTRYRLFGEYRQKILLRHASFRFPPFTLSEKSGGFRPKSQARRSDAASQRCGAVRCAHVYFIRLSLSIKYQPSCIPTISRTDPQKQVAIGRKRLRVCLKFIPTKSYGPFLRFPHPPHSPWDTATPPSAGDENHQKIDS